MVTQWLLNGYSRNAPALRYGYTALDRVHGVIKGTGNGAGMIKGMLKGSS